MRVSYVGIANTNGLAVFLPEARATRAFVEHHARRARQTEVACFWIVLDRTEAQAVAALLEAGDSWGALLALDRAAERLGAILPFQNVEMAQQV